MTVEVIPQNPGFIPLEDCALRDTGLEWLIPQRKLVLCSLEGPNGTGKTSVWRQTLNIVMATRLVDWIHGNNLPLPVIGVVEPPPIHIAPGRQDTWRSLAKSGKSMDGIVRPQDLGDATFQAQIFLWARRLVEEAAFFNFPQLPAPDSHWQSQSPALVARAKLEGYLDAYSTAQHQLLLKDRGTGSTMIYQGGHPDKGREIKRLIADLYKRHFLIMEDLTILVLPYAENDLNRDPSRDVREGDQFSNVSDVARYEQLYHEHQLFSRRLIMIRNDPTGSRIRLSSTAFFAAVAVLATEAEKSGQIKIQDGVPFRLRFSLGVLGLFDKLDIGIESRELGRGIAGLQGSDTKPWINGDIGILSADENFLTVVFQRGLENSLS